MRTLGLQDLALWLCCTQQISLTFVAAFGLEAVKIIFSLTPLGGHDDTEARSAADDRARDRLRVDVGTEIVDERAVDLDLVEAKAPSARGGG
jgi:hypothetical protein